MSEAANVVLPLTEVLDFREGPGIMAVDFRSTGIPLIRLAGLKGGADLLTGCNFLDPDKVSKKWSQFQLEPGDVLLSTSASLGEVAVVRESGVGAVPYTGIIRFRPRDARVLAQFIPFALRSPEFKQQIVEMGVGSVMNHFGPSHLKHMTLRVPSVPQQRGIAGVLGAIDDKIASNAKLARSALTLAGSLFDRELDRAIRVRLGDVSTIVLGGTPSKARMEFWSNGTIPWIASGKANEDRILQPTSLITSEALAQSAAKLMPRGATVIAITGATLGQISRLEIEACGNQSLVGIWGETTWDSDWLYFAISSERPQLLRGATGAAQQHVNKADVENLQVPWCDESLRQAWGTLAGKLLERARQADVESHSLVELRDILLPALMSGQLRVKDAERIVKGEVW